MKNEKDFGIETHSNTSTHNYDVCIAERYILNFSIFVDHRVYTTSFTKLRLVVQHGSRFFCCHGSHAVGNKCIKGKYHVKFILE